MAKQKKLSPRQKLAAAREKRLASEREQAQKSEPWGKWKKGTTAYEVVSEACIQVPTKYQTPCDAVRLRDLITAEERTFAGPSSARELWRTLRRGDFIFVSYRGKKTRPGAETRQHDIDIVRLDPGTTVDEILEDVDTANLEDKTDPYGIHAENAQSNDA